MPAALLYIAQNLCMRILIVEDEPLAVERLSLLLQQFDPSIEIAGTADSIESASQWLNTRPIPDIIFMDIELGDGKCFPLLDLIQHRSPIIFTTAYDQFALQAVQHLCIDYLLKPVSAVSLAKAMQKLNLLYNRGTEPRYKKKFLVRNGIRMQFVDIEEVSYFFAEGKNSFLVREDGMRLPIEYTLEKLETMLDPRQFFRFSRKIIGGIHAIKDIRMHENSRLRIALHAGNQQDEAIVSRERVSLFKQWAEIQ